MSKSEAEGFYEVHRERPFFEALTTFMSSGPAIVLALQAHDAIARWRTVMGATDPAKADEGTLRRRFGCYRWTKIERATLDGEPIPTEQWDNAVRGTRNT